MKMKEGQKKNSHVVSGSCKTHFKRLQTKKLNLNSG